MRGRDMRIRTIALAVATGLAVAACAVAASAPRDPNTLILLRKDFPAHSDYDSSRGEAFGWPERLTSLGVESAQAANYTGAAYSTTKGLLTVAGVIVTTASAGDATKAFAIVAKKNKQLWGQRYKPVSGVPHYGDRQTATYSAPSIGGSTGIIHLLVRNGSVLWYLSVSLQRGPPGPPLSELLDQVKTYAAEQRARLG
jgi:hypothetical protein